MNKNNLINVLTPKGKKNLKLFFRFLKENHCFNNYRKAFDSSHHDNMQLFQDACNCNICLMLPISFTWDKTEEGYNFWYNIHQSFLSLTNQLERISK